MRKLRWILLGLIVFLAGCPLPFDYSGEGSGTSVGTDPSTPTITAPVVFSYSDTAGASGTVPSGDSFFSNQTTTVTLSTPTENATVYYIDDGGGLTSLASAKSFGNSSGDITIERSTGFVSKSIVAVAVGPGMLPSPPVLATFGVSAFPVITISRTSATVTEDGGSAGFVLSSSLPADSDLTIDLLTGGSYQSTDISSSIIPPGGPGTPFQMTLLTGQSSLDIDLTGQPDADDFTDDEVVLAIQPGADYTVGSPGEIGITVVDNARPTISVTRSAAVINDDNRPGSFKVSAGAPVPTDVTVTLLTGGNYEAADVTGLAAAGVTFDTTIPAGQPSVTIDFTTSPDLGEYNDETITLTLQSSPSYGLGSPSSVSMTVNDTSPVPTITLAADRTVMVDGQAAVFTINASVAPEVNLTIPVASTGYDAGKIIVPTTVTLSAGTAGASFQVSAPSEAGYVTQTPRISLTGGTGYTVGTPNTQTLLVTDNGLGYSYAGYWDFEGGDLSSPVGAGSSWILTGAVVNTGGRLSFPGNYMVDYATVDAPLDKNRFTMGVRFRLSNLSSVKPIIVGGSSARWFRVDVATNGQLKLELNNAGESYTLTPALTASVATDHTLVVTFDAIAERVIVWLDGIGTPVSLVSPFAWNSPTADEILISENRSNARVFAGDWDWVFLANGLLVPDQVSNLIATDPALQ